jgi:hypothetical protein
MCEDHMTHHETPDQTTQIDSRALPYFRSPGVPLVADLYRSGTDPPLTLGDPAIPVVAHVLQERGDRALVGAEPMFERVPRDRLRDWRRWAANGRLGAITKHHVSSGRCDVRRVTRPVVMGCACIRPVDADVIGGAKGRRMAIDTSLVSGDAMGGDPGCVQCHASSIPPALREQTPSQRRFSAFVGVQGCCSSRSSWLESATSGVLHRGSCRAAGPDRHR